MRHRVRHQVRRIGNDQRIEFRLRVEDRLEEPRCPAELAAGFVAESLDEHQIFRFDGAAVDAARRDQETLLVNPHSESPFGTGEEHLPVGAADQFGHLVAQLHLLARPDFRIEGAEVRIAVEHAELNVGIRQVVRRADLRGTVDEARAEIQRFEALERLEQCRTGGAGSVIFQQNRTVSGGKGRRDILAERFAAGNLVGSVADRTADHLRRRMHRRVRNLPGDAEGDQRRRMRVQNRFHIRANLVDGAVEGEFTRGLVAADHRAVRLDADDVFAMQRAFVDTAGADPHVSFGVEDREVSTGSRGHAVPVDTLHDLDDLVARVYEIGCVH